MIKPFYKLREEEFLWLIQEKTTCNEIDKDFPQPSWCFYPGACAGFGCWSLIDFSSGYSAVTDESFCEDCPCYKKACG